MYNVFDVLFKSNATAQFVPLHTHNLYLCIQEFVTQCIRFKIQHVNATPT